MYKRQVLSGEIGGVLTQAFQGLVIVVAGFIFTASFFAVTGGFGPVLEVIASTESNLDPSALTAWGTLPGAYAFAWVLLPALGIMCQPQVLTRMTMLRTPRELPKLSLYAVVTNMITGLMVMAIGYCAIFLVATGKVAIDHPDSAVFRVADYLGILAQMFVYPAVLAAALSTSSLFLSLAGTIVSRDLPGSLGINISPVRQVSVSRIAMMVMGLSAIGFAAVSGDMVAILGTYGFGTLAAATFPIFVIGLLWKRASSRGVMLGMLTALVTTLGGIGIELLKRFDLSTFAWPGNVPWYVFVLTASVTVTIAASLLDRAAGEDQLDRRVRMALDL